jgi:hypothetical protein
MFPGYSVLMLGALNALSCASPPALPCFVELPIYDATGNRLSLDVVKVTAVEPPEEGDLLRSNGRNHMVWKDNRLYFAQRSHTTGIELTVRGGNDERGRQVGFTERVALYGCQQRASLQYGARGAGVDVASTTVRGRISGCTVSGDWWVRAIPMFGAQTSAFVVHEGYSQKTNGS